MSENHSERTIICLRCPRGCEVHTTVDDANNVIAAGGNICRLGKEYVQTEVADPRRVFTSTVRVRGGVKPLVAVWTPRPIPKTALLALARDTRLADVSAPVRVGQVVMANWRGTGTDIVASETVQKTPNG
jgi:CxxC motif-containing protein